MLRNNPDNSLDFRLTYETVKSLDQNMLLGMVGRNSCVDVGDYRGLFTPAAQFAADNNQPAVELLMKFGASLDYVAMGYASAGFREKAEELRKNNSINIRKLAIGAAMHADSNYAEWLREKYNLNPEWFVYGAAIAGNFEYCEKLNELASKAGGEIADRVKSAYVKGLVLGGHIDKAEPLVTEANKTDSDLLLRVAIEAAARTANKDGLQRFLNMLGTNKRLLRGYYEDAAIGAAKGGHIEYALSLLEETNKSVDQYSDVIYAGMKYGHFNRVAEVMANKISDFNSAKYLSHELTMRAAIRGQHKKILEVMGRQPDADMAHVMAEIGKIQYMLELAQKTFPIGMPYRQLVKSMDQGSYFQSRNLLLYTLSFLEDSEALGLLSKEALAIKSNTNCHQFKHGFFNEFMDIYKQSRSIHARMQRYSINYDQALALQEHKLHQFFAMIMFKGDDYAYWGKFLTMCGLTQKDGTDLIEKYMTSIAKNYIDKRLRQYHDPDTWGAFAAKAIKRHVDRSDEMLVDVPKQFNRKFIKDKMIGLQYLMFTGQSRPDDVPGKRKWEKPLTNTQKDGTGGFYETCDELYHHKFLNK